MEAALKIYFDGLCPLCSREIDHYRSYENSDRLEFIDIAHPNFDAVKEGLDPVGVHKKFHVKKVEGEILEGVPAFIEIWKTLEIWRPMQWAASAPLLKEFFKVGYLVFAKIRPVLRRNECDSDYCAS